MNEQITIVIDDERNLPLPGALVARTSTAGIALLEQAADQQLVVNQLWLDHDLGFVDGVLDDIRPVLAWLEERAYEGTGPEIETIFVHTANPVGAQALMKGLGRWYNVRRVALSDVL